MKRKRGKGKPMAWNKQPFVNHMGGKSDNPKPFRKSKYTMKELLGNLI